jgi:CheY-like chemotaxis protein
MTQYATIDFGSPEHNAAIGNGASMQSVISEAKVVRPDQAPYDILVVEDNTAVREVLREILHDENYHVHTVIHGQDALEYLSETPILPRLILLDLMMPIMTGWEFRAVQRADDRLRDIPVIVLTAVIQDVLQEQLEVLDAIAVLRKPINWNKLLNVIAQIVPGKTTDGHQVPSNILPDYRYGHGSPVIEHALAAHTVESAL